MSTSLPPVRRGRNGRRTSGARLIEPLEQRRLLTTWTIEPFVSNIYEEGQGVFFSATPDDASDPEDFDFVWTVTLDGNPVADGEPMDHQFGGFLSNGPAELVVSLSVVGSSDPIAPFVTTVDNGLPTIDDVQFYVPPELESQAMPEFEGQAFQVVVVATDPGSEDQLNLTYRLALQQLNGASWVTQFFFEGGVGDFQKTMELSIPDEGDWRVFAAVIDDTGGVSSGPFQFSVLNAPPAPTVEGAPAGAVNVGEDVDFTVSANDPGESNDTLYPSPPYTWQVLSTDHDDTYTYDWTITRVDDNTVVATGDTDQISFTPTEAGTYEYVVTVTDNALDPGMASGSFEVVADVADEASIAYSGLQHIATESSSDTTARVDLRATLTDIGGDAADIGSALVAFSVYHPVDGLIHSSQVGVSSSDGVVGVASDSFIYTLSATDAALTVLVEVVGGGYTADPLSVPLTVSRAETGRVVGAGIMLNTNSGGSLAAAGDTRTLFAFAARRTSGSLTGAFSMTYLGADGNAYMVVSTDVSSLFTWTDGGVRRAAMSAEVDVYHVRRMHGPALVHSDLTLEMTLTDAGHNGHFDRAAFAVWNPAGGLVFGSYVDPTTNSVTEQLLEAGNITIWSS